MVSSQPQHDAHTHATVGIIFYSFSGQSLGLVHQISEGLTDGGCTVFEERLQPVENLRFPLRSIGETVKMMLTTFFRKRELISDIDPAPLEAADLIILAGPTWSYNPSGPVLSFLDRYGKKIFHEKTVLPLISCRGYWRLHWYGLRRILENCGARVPNCMIFTHPSPEPWRTIGVFLKIAGRTPETSKFLGRHYPRFGHTNEQRHEARRMGKEIGTALRQGTPMEYLDFRTSIAMPLSLSKEVRCQKERKKLKRKE